MSNISLEICEKSVSKRAMGGNGLGGLRRCVLRKISYKSYYNLTLWKRMGRQTCLISLVLGIAASPMPLWWTTNRGIRRLFAVYPNHSWKPTAKSLRDRKWCISSHAGFRNIFSACTSYGTTCTISVIEQNLVTRGINRGLQQSLVHNRESCRLGLITEVQMRHEKILPDALCESNEEHTCLAVEGFDDLHVEVDLTEYILISIRWFPFFNNLASFQDGERNSE